jgi:CheY-like chemotaxis protein
MRASHISTEGGSLPKTILVVEDESQLRAFVKLMLNDEGFRVIEASDGTGGLNQIRRKKDQISLLITDVDMGRMGGIELAELVRKEFPNLPILFISALPMAPSELQAVAPGSGFVSKPFNATTLLQSVRRLVE